MATFLQARHYRVGRTQPGTPSVIVIHTAECTLGTPGHDASAEGVAAYFHNQPAITANPTSAHACVDSDSIVECVRPGDTAYHCGTHGNAVGYGIEHSGHAAFTTGDWSTPAAQSMLRWSASWAAKIAKQYGIPAVRLTASDLRAGKRGFCGHIDVHNAWPADTTHTDPGTNWPWVEYLGLVVDVLHPAPTPPPTGTGIWEDDEMFMYLRAAGPAAGHAILVAGGKQVMLEGTGLHANAFAKAGVPYATSKDANQEELYDKAYGPPAMH